MRETHVRSYSASRVCTFTVLSSRDLVGIKRRLMCPHIKILQPLKVLMVLWPLESRFDVDSAQHILRIVCTLYELKCSL